MQDTKPSQAHSLNTIGRLGYAGIGVPTFLIGYTLAVAPFSFFPFSLIFFFTYLGEFGLTDTTLNYFILAYAVTSLLGLLIAFRLTAMRLRDMGVSETRRFLLLAPFVNILMLVVLTLHKRKASIALPRALLSNEVKNNLIPFTASLAVLVSFFVYARYW